MRISYSFSFDGKHYDLEVMRHAKKQNTYYLNIGLNKINRRFIIENDDNIKIDNLAIKLLYTICRNVSKGCVNIIDEITKTRDRDRVVKLASLYRWRMNDVASLAALKLKDTEQVMRQILSNYYNTRKV